MNLASLLTDSRRLIYILGGAIAVMVFVTIIFILRSFGSQTGSGTSVALEVWGVFDDQPAFSAAIKSFQQANKGIAVTYKLIPYATYASTLLNALAAGTGPDVFMIHNTWVPAYANKIAPLPATFPSLKGPLMTTTQFQNTFVGEASNDLIAGGKIYGMPLYMDTLALYYNKDLLASAGIPQPPSIWTDFQSDIKLLTKFDPSHNITQSGAAMGTYRNINRGSDILMMLMLQSGSQMTSTDNTQATFARSVNGQNVGERTLQFYTDFANPQKEIYTWNDSQDYSIDAFTAGKTAMMINYAHQMATIRQKAPRLNFGVAPVPQATLDDKRTYGDYWPFTVALQSKHPYEAWQFIYYMTAGDGNLAYLNAASRPTARLDLVSQQKNDPDLGVFAAQSLTARSWYQIDDQAIEKIFADMIDGVNLGRQSYADALKQAQDKVTVLMSH